MQAFKEICKKYLKAVTKGALAHSQQQLSELQARLSRLEDALQLEEQSGEEWHRFYQAFEMNFRGHPQAIIVRLQARYENLLRSYLASPQGKPPVALDLGCGHGEFLRLSTQLGFTSLGIDQSSEAVAYCRSQGLSAEQGDLLGFLKAQADGSATVISFLHVIEHCPQGLVLQTFREAFRVLAPGGLFLIETPSLLSLWAGVRQFYLDPTHNRPVHPDYICFMARYCGFQHTELRAFGEVEHPQRVSLEPLKAKLGEDGLSCLQTWESWFFGPMDLCCLARK